MRFLSCFILITVSAVLVAGPAHAKKSKFRMSGCWKQPQESGLIACFYKTGFVDVAWVSRSEKEVEGFNEAWRWSRDGKMLSFNSEGYKSVCEMVPAQPVDHFSLQNCRPSTYIPGTYSRGMSGSWMKFSPPSP